MSCRESPCARWRGDRGGVRVGLDRPRVRETADRARRWGHACLPRAGRGRVGRLHPRQRERPAQLGAAARGDRGVSSRHRLQPLLRTPQRGHPPRSGRPDAPPRRRRGLPRAGDRRRPRAPRRPLLGRLHLPIDRDSASPAGAQPRPSGAARAVALRQHPTTPQGAAPATRPAATTALSTSNSAARRSHPPKGPYGAATTSRRCRHSATACSARAPTSGFPRCASSRPART